MGQRERRAFPVGNPQHGQAAARVVAEDLGVHLDAVDHDPGAVVVAEDGRGGEDRALVVDEETAASQNETRIAGTNLDDSRFRLVEEGVGLVAGQLKDIGGAGEAGKNDQRRAEKQAELKRGKKE